MDYAKESLRLHGEWKGKIEVVTRVPAWNRNRCISRYLHLQASSGTWNR